MLTQVIIDNEHVLALIHEILAHGAAGIGGDVLHGRLLRSRGGDHNGVLHGPAQLKIMDNLGHRRALLTNGHIDTDHILPLLVQDGVGCNGGFSGLAVADDELPLSTANGNHGINGLNARLQGDRDGFSLDDTRRLVFNGPGLGTVDGAFAVDGVAQSIHHPANQLLPHRDGKDLPGAPHQAPFLHAHIRAQHNHTDAVLLQVQRHAHSAAVKAEQLVGPAAVQTVDLGNAVSHLDHVADFILLGFCAIVFDLVLNDLGNFVGFQVHVFTYFTQSRRPGSGAALPAGPAGSRPAAPRQSVRSRRPKRGRPPHW